MSLDHLLLWLSAKGMGSWSQFRAAVEELHVLRQQENALDEPDTSDRSKFDLPVYHEVRFALQRLGHVEFDTGKAQNAWCVVPPSLAFMPGDSARGLLCGARSAALLDRLRDIANVEELLIEGMPRRVILSGTSVNAIAGRVRELGVYVQEQAPTAMLCAIPSVRNSAIWTKAQVPETPGWIVHRFSPTKLKWKLVPQDEASRASSGLFRFVMKHQRFYYLHWRSHLYRVPVQVGKYAVMGRRQGTLAYEPARGIFSVPAICRPPLLVERALVLCSGVLPSFSSSSGRLEYADVPIDVARLAAQLLCQEMQ